MSRLVLGLVALALLASSAAAQQRRAPRENFFQPGRHGVAGMQQADKSNPFSPEFAFRRRQNVGAPVQQGVPIPQNMHHNPWNHWHWHGANPYRGLYGAQVYPPIMYYGYPSYGYPLFVPAGQLGFGPRFGR